MKVVVESDWENEYSVLLDSGRMIWRCVRISGRGVEDVSAVDRSDDNHLPADD